MYIKKKKDFKFKMFIILICVALLNILVLCTLGKNLGESVSFLTKLKIDEITKYNINSVVKKYLNLDTNDYIKTKLVNNNIVSVDDGDSIIMAQKFSKDLGLGIGISSGANFIGAVKVLAENNFQHNIVTVFSDDNKKYLSTDLMKEEPVKDNFISTNIELLDLNVL